MTGRAELAVLLNDQWLVAGQLLAIESTRTPVTANLGDGLMRFVGIYTGERVLVRYAPDGTEDASKVAGVLRSAFNAEAPQWFRATIPQPGKPDAHAEFHAALVGQTIVSTGDIPHSVGLILKPLDDSTWHEATPAPAPPTKMCGTCRWWRFTGRRPPSPMNAARCGWAPTFEVRQSLPPWIGQAVEAATKDPHSMAAVHGRTCGAWEQLQ